MFSCCRAAVWPQEFSATEKFDWVTLTLLFHSASRELCACLFQVHQANLGYLPCTISTSMCPTCTITYNKTAGTVPRLCLRILLSTAPHHARYTPPDATASYIPCISCITSRFRPLTGGMAASQTWAHLQWQVPCAVQLRYCTAPHSSSQGPPLSANPSTVPSTS